MDRVRSTHFSSPNPNKIKKDYRFKKYDRILVNSQRKIKDRSMVSIINMQI